MGSAPQGSKYLWFDADTLIYLAAITECKFDLPFECADLVLKNAMTRFQEVAEQQIGHPVVVLPCLSSSPTFRHQLEPSYKANRIGKWRPPLLPLYTDVFKELYPCLVVDNYEADDIVGILHSQIPGHILCSGDKDLQQFAGLLYNPRTLEFKNITLTDALRFRLFQWIKGDTADGYGGCAGIGDVKAGRLVDSHIDSILKGFLEPVVSDILELYAIQNSKEVAKEREPRDPIINFQMSQILYKPNTNISDPVLFLQDWREATLASQPSTTG